MAAGPACSTVMGILAATARRPRVAPATLATGTGMGVVLGAVMYAVFPLGGTNHATNPWLHGFPILLVVLLAWAVLLGGTLLASTVAVRCYRGPGRPGQATKVKARQAVAAGLLATAIGALLLAVLGTVTVAAMPRAGWVMHWLYPGGHLSAAVAFKYQVTASVRVIHYGLILLGFPVVGLLIGLAVAGSVAGGPAVPAGYPPSGGVPYPPGHPAPDPPADIRLAAVTTAGRWAEPAASAIASPERNRPPAASGGT